MAKQMNFTDPKTGANYPESYWNPSLHLHTVGDSFVIFKGYANIAARTAQMRPVFERRYPGIAELSNSFTFADAYTIANADPEGFFTGAVDV